MIRKCTCYHFNILQFVKICQPNNWFRLQKFACEEKSILQLLDVIFCKFILRSLALGCSLHLFPHVCADGLSDGESGLFNKSPYCVSIYIFFLNYFFSMQDVYKGGGRDTLRPHFVWTTAFCNLGMLSYTAAFFNLAVLGFASSMSLH